MTATASMYMKKLVVLTKMKNILFAAKTNALMTACVLLLSGMGIYAISSSSHDNSVTEKDVFVSDIKERSDLVNNSVTEVINDQGKQSPLMYKQTCENSISFIRKERLDTNYNYNTLSPEHKELVNKYRGYLKEAAYVVVVASGGEQPDRTKLDSLKKDLI